MYLHAFVLCVSSLVSIILYSVLYAVLLSTARRCAAYLSFALFSSFLFPLLQLNFLALNKCPRPPRYWSLWCLFPFYGNKSAIHPSTHPPTPVFLIHDLSIAPPAKTWYPRHYGPPFSSFSILLLADITLQSLACARTLGQ